MRIIKYILIALLTLSVVAEAQVVPGPTSGGGPTSVIVGQLQTATGGTINNGTLTFTLSQPAVVSGIASLATQQSSCYTANSGNIVGVPDPTVLPITSTNTSAGTLPAGTYYLKIYYAGSGGFSAASPEAVVSLPSQGTIYVNPPALQPSVATGFFGIGIGTTSGGEIVQIVQSAWTQYAQSVPLTSGAAPPSVNTSSCSLYFSDQLIPTGTNYTVNLVNKNGSKVAGFPQTWCTYGGAGATINVSNGTPTGNCNTNGVFYPTPIMANPPNSSGQSVAGNFSVGGNLNSSGAGGSIVEASATISAINQTLYVGAGITQWGSGDLGSQIATAIASQTCANIIVIGGTYTMTTAVTMPRCAKIYLVRGSTITWSGAGPAAFIVSDNLGTSTYPEGSIDGLTLAGSGSGIGIYFGGDPAGIISPVGNYGDDFNVNYVHVSGFATGVQWGNNAWAETIFESVIANNATGLFFPSTVSLSGESLALVNSRILNNAGIGVKIGNTALVDLNCSNSSIDYNGSWAIQNGTALGNQQVTINGCHIEQTDHWMQNYGIATMLGGEFTNGTLSGTLGYLIDNEGVALSVYGGAYFNGGSGMINNPAGLPGLWLGPTSNTPINNYSTYIDRFGNIYSTVSITEVGPFGSTAVQQIPSSCETAGAPTTLNVGGTTTNTGLSCLPANSVIDAVAYRITTTITTAVSFTIGDGSTAARFCSTQSTLTAGTTGICLAHSGTSSQVQAAAAAVRVTTNANPGAGAIRLIVYYHTWTAPTS